MSNENRFSGLMGDLGGGKASAKKEASTRSPETAKSKPKPTKSIPKSKNPDYTQIGFYLPNDLHKRVKIGAAMTGLEMSDVAAQALELWLKKNVSNN